MKALGYIGKIYTVFVGVILILLSAKLMQFVLETNKIMEVPFWTLLAGLFGTILLTILGIWLIVTTILKQSERAVVDSKAEYQQWLTKRIKEIEIEYDEAETASYGTGLKYDSTATQRVISKGSKLRAYKEILDYVNTH
jgi:putative Mn2+ efflux pump MntP